MTWILASATMVLTLPDKCLVWYEQGFQWPACGISVRNDKICEDIFMFKKISSLMQEILHKVLTVSYVVPFYNIEFKYRFINWYFNLISFHCHWNHISIDGLCFITWCKYILALFYVSFNISYTWILLCVKHIYYIITWYCDHILYNVLL